MSNARYTEEDGVNIDGGAVTITVGREDGGEKVFTVHETLLRSESAFFDTAFKNEWREGHLRNISLPEHDPSLFRRYVQWLYTAKLACAENTEAVDDSTLKRTQHDLLTKLYVLGEGLIAPRFQDAVVESIVAVSIRLTEKGMWQFPCKDHVSTIYNGTLEGSPARKLMVDFHVQHGNGVWIAKATAGNQSDFLKDLVIALLDGRPKAGSTITQWTKKGVPCEYHKHGKDEPCNTNRKKT